MGPISVLNTAFASIALFTCFLQLFLALKKRSDILTLISAVLSLVVFIRYSVIFLCSAPLALAEHHLTVWRCQLILTQLVTICMLGVIFHLMKDSRKLIIFLYVLIISLLAILCLLIPDDLLFDNNEVIYLDDLSHGDNIPMIGKGFTLWRALIDLTILLFVLSTYLLLVKKLKSASRQKIIVLLAGTSLVFVAAIYDQFIDLDLINTVYLLPFAIFIFYMILNFVPYLFLLEEVAENNLISQQEKKWRSLIFGADIIVVGLNRMGQVDFVNPYFLQLTGYTEDEILGKDWFEFAIPRKDSFTVQGAFIEALESEFPPYYENPIVIKSKEERMIRWYNTRTQDKNGIITGSLSIGLDITEDLRKKEDIISQLKAAQDLIDKLKSK